MPELGEAILRTTNWKEVVCHPEVDVVVEAIGGTGTASHVIEECLRERKSVVTANKELMALRGADLWDRANQNGVNLAMEASVAGGIPIHTVLREGISGDRITELYGILNGTSNFILTEIEKSSAAFESVLAEAQQLGYAEADPSADVDGLDAALQAGDSGRTGIRGKAHAGRYLIPKASGGSCRSTSSMRIS